MRIVPASKYIQKDIELLTTKDYEPICRTFLGRRNIIEDLNISKLITQEKENVLYLAVI